MRFSLVVISFWYMLFSTAVFADVPISGLIVPGKSIGAVVLGMSHDEVVRAIGRPSWHFRDGLLESMWIRWKPHSEDFAGVTVFFRKGRVVQIATDLPDYRTAEGVNCLAAPREFRRHYRGNKRYFDGKQIIGFYLDDRARGIALRVEGSPPWFGPEPRPFGLSPDLIVVHPPGGEIILDLSHNELGLTRQEALDGFTTDW